MRVLATSSHKGKPLHEANFTGAAMIVVGNEGAGVPQEILAQADDFHAVERGVNFLLGQVYLTRFATLDGGNSGTATLGTMVA